MMINKLISSFVIVITLLFPTVVFADFPEKPIQVIVGFAAGSAPDLISRGLSGVMGKELGQPVLVINQPGASGEIGAIALKNAKSDGYSIGFLAVSNIVILPNTRAVQFEESSFDYICQTYTAPVTVVVAQNSPFKTIADLLKFAHENPGKLLYGSTGPGTLTHISMAALLKLEKLTATHVPMQSLTSVVQAIAGGQVSVLTENVLVTKSGNLRPLVILSDKRSKFLPNIPNALEANIPYQASAWSGIGAPKGLQSSVKNTLEGACRKAVNSPVFLSTTESLAVEPFYRNGADFKNYVLSEFDRYAVLLKELQLYKHK